MAAQGNNWLRSLNLLALLGLVVVTAALLLRPSDDDGLLGLPELSAGGRAPRTVKAPRDFVLGDPETTARLRAEAVAAVLPTYDADSSAGLAAKVRIEAAFAVVAARGEGAPPTEPHAAPKPPERATIEAFMRALELFLDAPEVETVVRGGFSDPVRDGLIMVVRTIHEQRVVEDRDLLRVSAPDGLVLRVLDPAGAVDHEETLRDVRTVLGVDQAKALIDEVVAKHLEHLGRDEKRAVALLAKRLLRPNVAPNPEETALRRVRAEQAVRPVFIPIKRGEFVLRAGEVVTERHLMIVDRMTALLEAESRYQRPLGSALLAALLVVLAYRQARGRSFRPTSRDLGLMTSAYLTTLLATWLAYKGAVLLAELMPSVPASAWRALVPVATGPLLLRFLVARTPAQAFAVLSAVTTGLMMDVSLEHTILVLAGGLAATLVPIEAERPRLSVLGGGLTAGVAQVIAVSVIALLGSRWSVDGVWTDSLFALASGLVSGVLVLVVTPVADVMLGYTSPLKMRELSSLNHALLRELLVQAPGTYHHSIMVGALAEEAARAIGADAVLARVGGYYHDIGKLKNPRVFLENQRPAPRAEAGPFVELSPVLGEDDPAIRAHVTDGLELAAQRRLGATVADIIAQHHGTREVRSLVRGRSLRPEPAADTHYSGPRPTTREAALVMIADGVEAAAEALLASAPIEEGMLEATVSRVVHEVIAEQQLVECPLTLADLSVVEQALVRVLREMLTRRSGGPAVRWSEGPEGPVYVVPPTAGRPN